MNASQLAASAPQPAPAATVTTCLTSKNKGNKQNLKFYSETPLHSPILLKRTQWVWLMKISRFRKNQQYRAKGATVASQVARKNTVIVIKRGLSVPTCASVMDVTIH